jgi:hypothetical protein
MIYPAMRRLWLGLVIATSVRAQTVVDEGSFTITVAGARSGRETFVIRRTAGADGYLASGTVLYADRRLAPVLTADSTGVPTNYTMTLRSGTGTTRTAQVSAQWSRGHFLVRMQTPTGESAHELALAPSTVLLDDDVYYQYYFLALDAPAGTLSILDPRRGTQDSASASRAGSDRVLVGNRPVDAVRWHIAVAGAADRDLWVDAAGRVLKVEIPGRQLTAVRDEPPH